MYGESSWLSTQQPVKMKKTSVVRIFSGIAAKNQCICPTDSKRKPWVFKKQARNNSRACFLYNYLEFLILAVIQ